MIRWAASFAFLLGACSSGSTDALVVQRQLIKGKWLCDFPNMKPNGENSMEFGSDGIVRQVTQGTSTMPGPSMLMHGEQVGAYSVNVEGLVIRLDQVVIHQMTIDGEAASAELLKSMEERMLGERETHTSPIALLDKHNLVLGAQYQTAEPQQLKCTR